MENNLTDEHKDYFYNGKKIAFCILGGGKSSRFKKDKRIAKIGDKRLIDFVISLIEKYTKTVYLSLRKNDDLQAFGVRINDEKPYGGPLCGIYTVMQNVDADYYIFLTADMPFVNKDMIDALLKTTKNGCDAAMLEAEGLWTPVPLIVSKGVADFFENNGCENRSIKALTRQFKTTTVKWNNPVNLFNVNTSKDLDIANVIFHGADNDFREFFIYEKSVELCINDELPKRLSITPMDSDEFVYGYLYVCGYINDKDSVVGIKYEGDKIFIKTKNGKFFTENRKYKKPQDEVVESAMLTLKKNMYLHNNIGGYHASGIFNKKGDAIFICEDVSRYATIDKCVGYAVLNNLDIRDCFIATTGRLTLVSIKKCINGKIGLIASRSNISYEALKLAKENEIVVRIYTGRNRRFKQFV